MVEGLLWKNPRGEFNLPAKSRQFWHYCQCFRLLSSKSGLWCKGTNALFYYNLLKSQWGEAVSSGDFQRRLALHE